MPEESKQTAADLVQARLGAIDDDVLEAVAREFPVEGFPVPVDEPPQAPGPPADTAPEPVTAAPSPEDVARFHTRRDKDPNFASIHQQLVDYASLLPEAEQRRLDRDVVAYNTLYTKLAKERAREEHRLAGRDYPLKFADEQQEPDPAEIARQAEEAAVQAEEAAETQLKEQLAESYRTRDWQLAQQLETRFAEKMLHHRPLRDPAPAPKKIEPTPAKRPTNSEFHRSRRIGR